MTKKAVLRGGDLQKSIIELAHLHRWKVAHFTVVQDIHGVWRTPAKADGKGFPDLVLVRDRLIMAEVKGDGDRLKPEQKLWMQWCKDAGVEHHVWTPSEWFGEEIARVLK